MRAALLRPGAFIRYLNKNELGVIKRVADYSKVYAWFHLGGTAQSISDFNFEVISNEKAFNLEFSNDYARASLIERAFRVDEGGDTSDLIDDCDVRDSIKEVLKKRRT